MKIKKSFLHSYFLRVLNIIKKNPHIYLYTIILDFIFLVTLIYVGKYIGSFIPADPQALFDIFKTTTNLTIFVLIYPIVYYLFIIFIYSITKLSILNLIKSLHEKNKFSLKGMHKFYVLNILIFLLFSLIALILFTILALTLTRSFLSYVVLILLIPLLFYLYSILNISHTLFIKNERNKLIRKSLKIAFNKIKKYGMFIIWDAILVSIYLIIYNLLHLLFKVTIFSNQELLTKYGAAYMSTFNIVSIILIYILIAFNRLYFYEKNVLS